MVLSSSHCQWCNNGCRVGKFPQVASGRGGSLENYKLKLNGSLFHNRPTSFYEILEILSVCVVCLCVSVLPCPEFVLVALPGNWLLCLRLDRSRLRCLLASPVIAATNA
jgi:hypothetical protein